MGAEITMLGMGPMSGALAKAFGLVDSVPEEACDSPSEERGVGGVVTQWATNDDRVFYAVGRTHQHLPPGSYEAAVDRGQVLFRRFDIDITGLMVLPDTQSHKIMDEIEKFWSRGDRFKKYKITQRRGILVAGPSGCGKTCTSKMVCVDVVRRGGVVIPFTNPRVLIAALSVFRLLQPETPIVVLMEDIDEIANDGDSSMFLNMLDGVYAEFSRVVFVATTNHPDRLERRITNRPSRFDCVITMEQPTRDTRLMYLKTIAGDIDPEVFSVEAAADATDKLSFAHLKELFTAVAILDIPFQEALAKVKKMAEEDLPTGDEMEGYGHDGFMGLTHNGSPLNGYKKGRRRR